MFPHASVLKFAVALDCASTVRISPIQIRDILMYLFFLFSHTSASHLLNLRIGLKVELDKETHVREVLRVLRQVFHAKQVLVHLKFGPLKV